MCALRAGLGCRGNMAGTDAQKTRVGKRVYGQNFHNGVKCEQNAARLLRSRGYSVFVSPGSRGCYDLEAKKGAEVKRIQVKKISSRALLSEDVARRRVAGAPFNVTARGIDEIWVYDRDGRRYEIKV